VIDGLPSHGKGALWIGGAWVEPDGARYAPVLDPSTGRRLADAPIASIDQARASVEAAASVEEAWAAVPGHRRARILRATSARLEADRETMARLIASEVGKPIVDARLEVDRAVGVFALAAEEIRHLGGESYPADAYERPPGNERRFLFTTREPIGVTVAIGPFNFPLNLLAHKVAPALAAGNPVVAKPPSAAPFTALRLAEHLAAAELPPGVLNVVVGPGGTVGDALVEHRRTRLVTFTGSTQVGKSIAGKAGSQAKRVILEMGGLDPFVVLADAPLGPTVEAAVRGVFTYAGQVCTASKRFVVDDRIAAEFSRRLADRADHLRVGPALDEATQVGPVIDRDALERLDRLVDDAKVRSAKVLAGGARRQIGEGTFYAPTVLDEVPEEARVVHEEPFGPVAPVLRFSEVDDAVRIANATEYGLQASVYTRDIPRGFELARRIRAGGVHLNDPTTLRWDALPFGGVRSSGMGREGLRYAMQEMTELKLISINYAPD